MKQISVIKQKAGDIVVFVVEAFVAVLTGSGAVTVAFFGKILAAVVLGAISIGILLRLIGRGRVKAIHQRRPFGRA